MIRLFKPIAMSLAAMVAISAIPATASAETCYERRNDNATAGAVVGALAGAAIGSSTSGRHSRGTGTAAGAIIGGALGASIGRGGTDCGYYGSRYNDRYYRDRGYSYSDDYYYDRPLYRRSYGYSRVYAAPSVVYIEPRRYYYRERYHASPRGYYRDYPRRHHRRW